MPTILKPERKPATLDPIATMKGVLSRQAESDLDFYRQNVFAAAEGHDFDANSTAKIMAKHGWTDELFQSDVAAAKDDLSQRSFEASYKKEMAELDAAAANPATISIRIDIFSGLHRRSQNPSGSPLTIPAEVLAAMKTYRAIAPKQQEMFSQMRILKAFHNYNQRLFSADAELAVRDDKPAITLETANRMANQPGGFDRPDELPMRHALARS